MKDYQKEIAELFFDLFDHLIQFDKTFQENGFDSLDAIEFLLEVETKFGVSFDDEVAFKIRTPNDLVELIGLAYQPKINLQPK